MYSEPLGKPSKQNTVINHEKHVKEESFKDIDDNISLQSLQSQGSKILSKV